MKDYTTKDCYEQG